MIQQINQSNEKIEASIKLSTKVKEERDALCIKLQELQKVHKKVCAERDKSEKRLEQTIKQLERAQSSSSEQSTLLETAQRMLEGQARYLEDLSRKEEQAEQSMDELRLLKKEISYYIQHSRPSSSLDPDQVSRLIELAKSLAIS